MNPQSPSISAGSLFVGLALLIQLAPHDTAYGAPWCQGFGQAGPELVARIARDASEAARSRPQPVPRLQTEGRLPSSLTAIRSREAKRDFDKVRLLAHAWRLGGDARFVRAARDLLLAWARTYRTEANPIDEAQLPTLVEGYALLRGELDGGDRVVIDVWLQGIQRGHMARLRKSKMIDNWRSHRIHIAASIALALDDAQALADVHRYLREQVLRAIAPDGTTFDFRKRNAVHYAVYTLEPLVATGLLLASAGPHAPERDPDVAQRLNAALDWLLPYVRGERTHREFDPPQGAFDRRRAAAGVPGFSGPWDPAGARALFWMAAYLDARYLPVARQLAPEPPDHLVACRGRPGEK
ncbi:MAG: alginate lyase family protein [Burkholderiales bacterium]|nr:alginate lyase family protein [Burkholderiales bacterium]